MGDRKMTELDACKLASDATKATKEGDASVVNQLSSVSFSDALSAIYDMTGRKDCFNKPYELNYTAEGGRPRHGSPWVGASLYRQPERGIIGHLNPLGESDQLVFSQTLWPKTLTTNRQK
jgi:hypothetical protein